MANDVIINVKANTAQAQSALSAINKSWVGVNSALDLGRKAAQFLGDAYNALVGDTQEYAQSVLKMTRISGQSAEMTSRMIELTDDFGIAQETLAVAMRSATTKGIAFTTDNLAAMSDEYVKLKPGIEQAQYAAEKFGTRAGAEMQKLLEKGSQAIRDQAASIDEHMLMTEENLQASEDWRIAQDNLNDSVTALGRSIGKELIPVLTDAADAAMLLYQWQAKIADLEGTARDNNVRTSKTYEEYARNAIYAAMASGRVSRALGENAIKTGDYDRFLNNLNQSIDQYNNGLPIMTRRTWDLLPAAQQSDLALNGMATTIESDVIPSMDESAAAADAMGARYTAMAAKYQEDTGAMAAKLRRDLLGALSEVQAANVAWAKGAGGDIASMLEQTDLDAGTLNQAFLALDKTMGTNEYTARMQQAAYKTIVDELERTNDVDAFKSSLQRLENGGFQPLTESVITARVAVQELYAELLKLDGQTATAYVNVISGSGGGTMTNNNPNPVNIAGAGKIGGKASGGPVMADTPYIVGERGPELFVPRQSGSIVPNDRMNAGGVTINNLNITLPGVSNASQLMAELGRLANNARNAGRAYQGA